MEDVSELFKIHFNLLHKGTTMPKTVQDRKQVLNNARKSKRESQAYIRRHITKDMSPINSPIPAKKSPVKKNTESPNNVRQENIEVRKGRPKAEGVSRLELLHKWRAEKAKQKELEKAKAKPIFKVYHVSSDLTADLENANKVIKGKPIVPVSASKKSQFAPPNHKFKPPKGIKPVSLNVTGKQTLTPAFQNKSTWSKLKCTPQQKTGNHAVIKKSLQEASTSSQGSSKQEPSKPSTSKQVSQPSERKEKNSKPVYKRDLKEIVKPTGDKFNTGKAKGLIEVHKNVAVPSTSNTTKTSHKSKKVIPTSNQRVTRNTAKARDGDLKSKNSYRKTPKKVLENVQRDLETNQLNIFVGKMTLDDTSEEKHPTKISNGSNTTPREKEDLSKFDDAQHSPQPVASGTTTTSSASTDYSVDYNNCPSAKSPDSVFDDKTPPPVYISPFVTISRGKNSARKEYRIRMSQGKCDFDKDTPELENILSAHSSSKAGAAYFRRKLDAEAKRIREICANWESYRDDPDLPEEAHSSIDVTLGQSKLLLSKKFEQFRGLISQCENENYEVKPVTCVDLHGFWDMIYMQVEDLDKRFSNLQKLKDNKWEEVLPQRMVPVKRARGRPKKAQTKSKVSQWILEAKNKQKELQTETDVIINGLDYAKILHTPPPKENSLEDLGSTKRKSLRMSVLNRESRSRCSSSPGLTMMKISQSIKQGDGLTPARGILKSDALKSTGKKSVVFKEVETCPKTMCKANLFHGLDKENISDNLINFSPVPLTPRRSTRFSKRKV